MGAPRALVAVRCPPQLRGGSDDEVMHTQVTIRLDRELLRRAQAYARRAHKSISTIVAEYFASLDGGKAR